MNTLVLKLDIDHSQNNEVIKIAGQTVSVNQAGVFMGQVSSPKKETHANWALCLT
jgi:hypothetical protein